MSIQKNKFGLIWNRSASALMCFLFILRSPERTRDTIDLEPTSGMSAVPSWYWSISKRSVAISAGWFTCGYLCVLSFRFQFPLSIMKDWVSFYLRQHAAEWIQPHAVLHRLVCLSLGIWLGRQFLGTEAPNRWCATVRECVLKCTIAALVAFASCVY